MNVIDNLTSRIEERLTETATPCKTYKTKEAAEKATAKMAQIAADLIAIDWRNGQKSARHVVFYVEAMGRWVGAVDMTELISRKTSGFGWNVYKYLTKRKHPANEYFRVCSEKGFYSY